MTMTRCAALILALPFAACSASSSPDVEACETATAAIEECYGPEVARTFAETCDATAAEEAAGDTCDTGEHGKADWLWQTRIDPDPVEHFKYGSIGADYRGLPVPVFRALPLVCTEMWRDRAAAPPSADPRDEPYAWFGMVYEHGHDTPVGISRRRIPFIGLELMGPNCATCHNASVRESPSSEPVVYLGAPGAQFDVESFNLFILDCVLSDDFTTGNLGAAMHELGEPSWLLRYVAPFLGPFVEDARDLANAIVRDGPWGPGRDDAIGLSAAFILGRELIPALPAPVDYPSSWNQDERRGGRLHWDGAAATAEERNILVSIGSGTPDYKVPFSSLDAIQRFIEDDLEPPPYPFANDPEAATRGAGLFASLCADCHEEGGARFGEVVPVAEIGTDPNRVAVITDESTRALNAMRGPGWEFGGFENTQGYLNARLDGVWLRAPYLHNGSVPTMRALLSPPEERPATFYRGHTVYDQADMGYVSDTPARAHAPSYGLFDTTRAGNANTGHVYGTDLTEAEKDDLIAYLRTL